VPISKALISAWLVSNGLLSNRRISKGASLIIAHLEGARLEGAHLEGADLSLTHLDGASLSEAVGLTDEQLTNAFGDDLTVLPEGLVRPMALSVFRQAMQRGLKPVEADSDSAPRFPARIWTTVRVQVHRIVSRRRTEQEKID